MEEENSMEGIQFVTDQSGNPTAVIIDLEQWGDIWEDFYDVLVSRTRQDEPEIYWEDLKGEIGSQNQKNG